MTSVYDIATARFITGTPADEIIDAHDKGKTSTTVMDEKAGEKGVLVEIRKAMTEGAHRTIYVDVIRGESG